MRRFRRRTTFPNFFLCHDLDDTVKSPLGMLVGAASFPSAPGCGRPFALKTRWMANFRMRFSVGHADALREHDGTETDGELLIRIHEPRRTHALGHGNVLPARFRWTEASHAQSRVPGGRPQTRTILTSPDDNSRVGSSSGNVLGFSSEVCRIGLLRSAKQGRRRGRRSGRNALGLSAFTKLRRALCVDDLVHPHRHQRRFDDPAKTEARSNRSLSDLR